MIHEIGPKQYHVEYHDLAPTPDDTIFIFERNALYMRMDGDAVAFPKLRELGESIEACEARGVKFRYLFSIDEERFFMPDVFHVQDVVAPDEYEARGDIMFRINKPPHLAFAGVTAQHIRQWYEGHMYCGHCGEKNTHSDIERATICPACGLIEYPKISPVVIIGVIYGDSILVTRYKERPGHYALVAGFSEIGEALEDTARREVFEETGVHIKNLRYYKSQPWAFSSSLISGFFCELEGDPAITVDQNELSEAIWLPRGEVPPQENTVAVTSEMMEAFRIGKA